MLVIARAKADEFFTTENDYEFAGKPCHVITYTPEGRAKVRFPGGRVQLLDAEQVRVKKTYTKPREI